jgi:hypothetical protein
VRALAAVLLVGGGAWLVELVMIAGVAGDWDIEYFEGQP